MSDYQIQKLRCPAGLTLSDGRMLHGDIFVQAVAPTHLGAEEPAEVFNDPEIFFPFAIRDGAVVILAKSSVVRADVGSLPPAGDAPADPDDLPLAPADPGVHVHVTLTDGSSVEGYVFPVTRAARPRLMDFLNDYDARFLPVITADGTSLVNCRCIVTVEQRS